eukprot:7123722-Pyramimonas_sp.AAC.1
MPRAGRRRASGCPRGRVNERALDGLFPLRSGAAGLNSLAPRRSRAEFRSRKPRAIVAHAANFAGGQISRCTRCLRRCRQKSAAGRASRVPADAARQ